MMALGAAVSAPEINAAERATTGKNLTFFDLEKLLKLNFIIHARAAPQLGGENSVYNPLFPWYDSKQFKQIQPDYMTRWIQGASTLRLPIVYINPNGERESGVKASEAALLDIQKWIPEFDEMYRTDAKINYSILENIGLDGLYLIYVADAGGRLPDTCKAFIGFSSDELINILFNHPENYREIINTREGIHQELLRELGDSYKILTYLIGYGLVLGNRYNVRYSTYIDMMLQNLARAYGYAGSITSVKPVPAGTPSMYLSISLPQEVADRLRQKYPDVLIGPGELLPLIVCRRNPLEKDGVRIVTQWLLDVSRYRIYLMLKE
jgi:hypothetical protein